MAQELKTPASIPSDLRQRLMECSPWTLMECSPWTWKYSLASEHEPGCRLRPGLSRFSSGRRGRASPKQSPKITKIKRITVQDNPPIPHSALPTPNPPVDSSLRPTTETAEAGKGRGPRFSSGRRSRANPKITKIKRITVQTSPPLTPPAATAYTPCWFPCDTPAVPLRHSHNPVALPRSGPVVGAASVILSRFRPESGPILSRIYPGVLV